MTAGCLRSAGTGGFSLLLLLLCCLVASGNSQAAGVNDDDCAEDIPADDYTVSASSNSSSPETGVWCPKESDTMPFIEYTLTNAAKDKWGLHKVMYDLVANQPNFDGYASAYNITVKQQDDWETLGENLSAVTQNATHQLYWTTTFTTPIPFRAIRLYPTQSFNDTGLCMKTTLQGCHVSNLCKTVTCGSNGKCVAENLCSCESGYFGANCSLTAYQFLQTIWRLQWKKVSAALVSTIMGEFTCSLSGGFLARNYSLSLNGRRSFLYATSLKSEYDCLMNPDGYQSFYVSFTYAFLSYNSTRIGLFGTNPDEAWKGCSAWITKSSGGVYFLHVEVRRFNSVWSISARTEAIQKVRMWTKLEISWNVSQGLRVFVDEEEVGHALGPAHVSSGNAKADFFVIGYPSYSYSEDYDVHLLVREFTVSLASRVQTLQAFSEGCSLECSNNGLCLGENFCSCLNGYHGPTCQYTVKGYSLEITSLTTTFAASSLGNMTIVGSGNVTRTRFNKGFSIYGTNTYVSLNSTRDLSFPWKGLVTTSTYSAFTVGLRFSIQNLNSSTYLMCTDAETEKAKTTGVNVMVNSSRHLTVNINLLKSQWRLVHQFDTWDKLSKGVFVEFTFSGSLMMLYVNGQKEMETKQAFRNDSLTASTNPLVFGAPYAVNYQSSQSNLQIGLTMKELIMWPQYREDIINLEDLGEPVDLERKSTTTTPVSRVTPSDNPTVSTVRPRSTDSDSTTAHTYPVHIHTTASPEPADSECSMTSFNKLGKRMINLAMSLLPLEPASRSTNCVLLHNITRKAESRVQRCWKSAMARNDSTSPEAFINYIYTDHIISFKFMRGLLCDYTSSRKETDDNCKLNNIEETLNHFYDRLTEYGMGMHRCSLLWTSYHDLSTKLMMCKDSITTVLKPLSNQVMHMASMACSPSTCNMDFTVTCLNAAYRSIVNMTKEKQASQQVCWDLKLSLACVTNHTIDCDGATYNRLFEHVHYVQARYRQACNVTSPKPDNSGNVSAQDAQGVLELSAYANLFPKPVLCSFAYRKEWRGKGMETYPPRLESSLLTDYCTMDKPEEPACQCNQSRSSFSEIKMEVIAAIANGNDSICDSAESRILALFDKLSGCDYSFKVAQVGLITKNFKTLCGKSLDTHRMVCPSYCNVSVCTDDVCGDASECLAQNTAGCDTMRVVENALYIQKVRDSEECAMDHANATVQLKTRPHLNGVLQCMRPVARSLATQEAMPIGQYCNALNTLRHCLKDVEEDASDDKLKETMAELSGAVLKRINTAVCNFMPEEECGSGSKADVVFLLDTSSSVGKENFTLLLTFITNVLSRWNLGLDEIRVGVIKFSTTAKVEFFLNDLQNMDKADFMDAIKNLEFDGGQTNTAAALNLMITEVFTEKSGDRKGVPDFGVIITDGKSGDANATLAAAARAHQNGIKILSVGIGGEVDMDELEDMASPPSSKHVMSAANYSQLAELQSAFLKQTCTLISDVLVPYSPSEGKQCSAFRDVMKNVEDSLLQAIRLPYYFSDSRTREEVCSRLPEDEDIADLSGCGDGEQKYLKDLYKSLVDVLQGVCGMHDVFDGCNLSAAASCVENLATTFIMPAVSPCSTYSKTEACVMDHTFRCTNGADWLFTYTMERWKKLAKSTCYKGSCDPAQAVLCFLDIQHMAKSPAPDWEGICSNLESSMQCAKENVMGCDRCQKDTIKTIGGKINSQLKKTCMDPPETTCRALAAMKCKELLTSVCANFSGDAGLLCLKIFQARKCVKELTEGCDSATMLSVSVELETQIILCGGNSCDKEKIIPMCYETLMDRVNTIVSFDPMDHSDPVYKYKYKPEAQDTIDSIEDTIDAKDKDRKPDSSNKKTSAKSDSKDKSKDPGPKSSKTQNKSDPKTSKNEGKTSSKSSKGSGGKSNKHTASKGSGGKSSTNKESDKSSSSGSTSMESIEIVDFPATYLGKVCREAQQAYICVSDSLREFPLSAKQGLEDVMSTTWKLAWLRCESIVDPLKCYECDGAANNELCDANGPVECGDEFQMCQTKVTNNGSVVINVEKSCVVPYECNPGCNDGICTYCCDSGAGCNEPDDGPVTGSCNLLKTSGCLSQLSSAFLQTDKVNCSFVEEQTACIKYSREQCEMSGQQAVSETLSGFLESKTVNQCRVELTDSRCGLYAVSALASFLIGNDEPSDIDFCPLLSNIERGLKAAEKDDKCDYETLNLTKASSMLLRSQLWFLQCGNTIQRQPTCDPLLAFKRCMPTSDTDCDLIEKRECIRNLTEGCQPVQGVYPYHRLLSHAARHCPNKTIIIPDLPKDLSALEMCLQTFSFNFNAGETNATSISETVNELIKCVLTDWDVNSMLTLPPVYKLYIKEVLFFLQDILLPAVEPAEGDEPITVTDKCSAALTKISFYFNDEVMLMMLRPFRSLSNPENFCTISKSLEVSITAQMTGCSESELKYQMRLMAKLRIHRLALCSDHDPDQQCQTEMASEAMQSFTAYMDITDDDDDEEICSVLNSTLRYVKTYTSTCNASQAVSVNQKVYEVLSTYRAMCSQVVSEAVCNVENATETTTETCAASPDVLDECDKNMGASLNCRSIKKVVGCYKIHVGKCNNTIYRNRFNSKFFVATNFGKEFCRLNLETWSIADGEEVCKAPICNVTTASACLVVTNIVGLDTEQKATKFVANTSACLQKNLAGCDVVTRADIIYKAQTKLSRGINALGKSYNPNLVVNFSDPFGVWVPKLVNFYVELHTALDNPKWDLLPLCWTLYDFSISMKTFVQKSPFKTALFERASYGFHKAWNGVCNDPDVVGGFLNLTSTGKDDACAVNDFMETAGTSFFEAVFTGILRNKSRKHLCRQLDKVKYNFDMSACSSGRQEQMKLLITFLQSVAGQVCELPRFCSVKRVKKCASKMVTTIQGLGFDSSTYQVCSAITSLDACVSRFSFRCRRSSTMRIRTATRSVRQMAMTVCGEIAPGDSLPTCSEPGENIKCNRRTALECSFNELFNILSTFSNRGAHCRILQYTHNCYDKVKKACTAKRLSRLPMLNLTALWSTWNCSAEGEETADPATCTENCHMTKAADCITNLSYSLRFWNPLKGSVCSMVTETRQCLVEKTNKCEPSDRAHFQKHLTLVLTMYSSLTSKCVDVYTCLDDFFAVSRLIVSKDDVPKPTSHIFDDSSSSSGKTSQASGDNSKAKTASEDKSSKAKTASEDKSSKGKKSNEDKSSKGKKSNEDKSSKGKKSSKSKDSSASKEQGSLSVDVGGSDSSLTYLCQLAHKNWECADRGLNRLSKKQRRLLRHIFSPLWSVISERCSNTVRLECYKCSNVSYHQAEDDCTEDVEYCDRSERCSSQYMTVGQELFVSRGCMKFAHCHAKDKKDMEVKCCDTDNCNTNADFSLKSDEKSMCALEYAVDCAFTFAENLVSQGGVDCHSSMKSLQCVAKHSEYCPMARSLYTAANQLMLMLAQTTCVQGALTKGCSSIAVSSMEAILSNAYSMDSACSGLNASEASVNFQEKKKVCTTLDLVALREALSFFSVITFSTCNPDDCKPTTTPTIHRWKRKKKRRKKNRLTASITISHSVDVLQIELFKN